MSVNEKTTVVVKYQTKPEECRCCGRPFENSEYGKEREFTLNINDFFEWSMIDLEDKEELQYVMDEDVEISVSDWVYETVSFYAISHTDILKIEQTEYDKVTPIIKGIITKYKVG